jgi:hypothetical protein
MNVSIKVFINTKTPKRLQYFPATIMNKRQYPKMTLQQTIFALIKAKKSCVISLTSGKVIYPTMIERIEGDVLNENGTSIHLLVGSSRQIIASSTVEKIEYT